MTPLSRRSPNSHQSFERKYFRTCKEKQKSRILLQSPSTRSLGRKEKTKNDEFGELLIITRQQQQQ